MKNFALAFFVFVGWCTIGMYFLNASDALNRKSLFSSYIPVIQEIDSNSLSPNSPLQNNKNIKSDLEDNIIDAYPDNNLTSGNEQIIETLTKSIEAKTLAIEKDKERLKEAQLKATGTKISGNTRKVDFTFYPEFYKGGKLVQDQKANNLLIYIRERLKNNPNARIKIVGHTDYVGNDIDNYKIALEWANKVKSFILNDLNLPDYQVSAYSSGENDPIVLNTSEDEGAKNNRIEVIIE